MAKLRVGGTFWAAQPDLPPPSFIVARPANAAQFRAMAAMASQQSAPVVFWLPDRNALPANRSAPMFTVVGPCDPWHLLNGADQLWIDPADELSFLAAIAAVPQISFADKFQPQLMDAIGSKAIADKLAALVENIQFRDPFSGQVTSLLTWIETLSFWRKMIDENRSIGSIYGVAFWKRPSIAPMMWNGQSPVRFTSRFRSASDASAAWIARTPKAILQRLAATNLPMFQIEDGFIRSVGLGANCVPPLSIVVDPHGAHYDPAQPSGLELMLASQDFTPQMLERARQLREVIVAQGISKYGKGIGASVREGGNRRHVLVTGQVEDDQSVIKGGGNITSNLELLRRVRAVAPDAFIIYRPHPDVDAGHRKGFIEDDVVLTVANSIAREDAITSLIEIADEVHVLTSLAGFEALMRGKPVITHGIPFYAGWGLTTDLGPVPPRRQRRRSLDELVAATLLLYPRYLDPVTRLPCPPEILIERLSAGGGKDGLLVNARRAWGRTMAALRNISTRRSPGLRVR